ncbi:ABC1 kinase family protein [Metabacillus idriensis]|uniref:ABC1 kinase family protein n=1 Tax=Metabacillus idriensis TaxID=324768 RepID=UPI003D2B4BC2
MKNHSKAYRMWKVLSFACSIFIQVYWFRISRKSEEEWERFWEKAGCRFREILFELEGLLIKVGQLLSIRADLLPNGFVRQIQDLVDQVPPSQWNEVKEVLEREWGCPIKAHLQFINPEAVASASIGEVFRGRLLNGSEVAIKVQRPAIRSIVDVDFRSLAMIMWFARRFAPVPKGFIDFNLLYKEIKQVIERELDFVKEKESACFFRERFKDADKLVIPAVYDELSTSEVLVMEWVEGTRITDTEFVEANQINRLDTAENLAGIFLPQWLEAGIFHADPHSGNVLLKEDGTIILLDFGMIGEISKRDAALFQDLLEAILLKNYSKAADSLSQLGFLLPGANHAAIEKLLEEALSFQFNKLKELDMIALNKELNHMVKSLPVQVPTRFVFLGRSIATIEGIIHTLLPEKETLEVIKPVFIDWMKKNSQNQWKLLLKWVSSLQIFQFVPLLAGLLESPKRRLDLEERKQKTEFVFRIYENQKRQYFFLGLLGAAGFFAGYHLQNPVILYGSSGIAGFSAFMYFSCGIRQRKWLKALN